MEEVLACADNAYTLGVGGGQNRKSLPKCSINTWLEEAGKIDVVEHLSKDFG